MPSTSLQVWRNDRRIALDELEAAYRSVGGTGRGRRYATQQINQAYAVLLCSQFQGFCRDMHQESADYFIQSLTGVLARTVSELLLQPQRSRERGTQSRGRLAQAMNNARSPPASRAGNLFVSQK